MKTFKQYLAEAVKTYQARIKIAGDLPEKFESKLKTYMDKYESISFKKTASTPVQEHPHEFPRLKNVEVTIFDVETAYPVSYQQLESVLKDEFGIVGDHIRVKHPTDPTEETFDDKEYDTKLSTEPEYKDDTASDKPLYGDEYNMTMFKELMRTRKEEESHEGDGKVVEMPEEKEKLSIHSKGEGRENGSGSSLTRHSK